MLGRSLKNKKNILSVDEPFFEVKQSREFSDTENEELKGVPIRNLPKLMSGFFNFNALNNKGLKRNATEIMPRIIHQIWLSKSEKKPSE